MNANLTLHHLISVPGLENLSGIRCCSFEVSETMYPLLQVSRSRK